eukprot:748227-Pyramimonas_sp.AAC.1
MRQPWPGQSLARDRTRQRRCAGGSGVERCGEEATGSINIESGNRLESECASAQAASARGQDRIGSEMHNNTMHAFDANRDTLCLGVCGA